MNVESLVLFVEVSRLGSFASVARKQNLDPSSVSRAISALEDELGLRLFQRTTRQLVLTEAGEIYLNRIEPLLSEFDYAIDAARKVSRGPNGKLKVTASIAFGQVCLLPHIDEFRHLYPGIEVELQLTDSVLDLVSHGIDLACRLAAEFDSSLVGSKLFDTKYKVCVSPEYYASNPVITCPEDLEQHECVVFTMPEYRSRWMFKDKQMNVSSVNINSSLSISSALALREAVLCGMGPSLLADWLVRDEIEKGNLVTVLNQYEVTAQNFKTAAWLLYPSRNFLPNKARVMIDFLKAKFVDY